MNRLRRAGTGMSSEFLHGVAGIRRFYWERCLRFRLRSINCSKRPVADALTHVGQIAMMRRLAEAPQKIRKLFKADQISPPGVSDKVPDPSGTKASSTNQPITHWDYVSPSSMTWARKDWLAWRQFGRMNRAGWLILLMMISCGGGLGSKQQRSGRDEADWRGLLG